MVLFLMRHGPAEDTSPTGLDFDRPLSAAGRECVAQVARELARRGERPGKLLTSPLVRARETAELVSAALSVDVCIDDGLAPEGNMLAVISRELRANTASVMLVGHEPNMSYTARAHGFALRSFDRAMVVSALVAHDREPVRRFVLDPHTLTWS